MLSVTEEAASLLAAMKQTEKKRKDCASRAQEHTHHGLCLHLVCFLQVSPPPRTLSWGGGLGHIGLQDFQNPDCAPFPT